MQPFVRGNEARTVQGSGLGLAIVKRIVDIHEGELTIRNRLEGGLEAIISLPINPSKKVEVETRSPFEKLKQSITEHF
jgi:two-component system, OmpR family, osmolarity sensor histidine kinase EnvZ